jgi:hypothetical protein
MTPAVAQAQTPPLPTLTNINCESGVMVGAVVTTTTTGSVAPKRITIQNVIIGGKGADVIQGTSGAERDLLQAIIAMSKAAQQQPAAA